MNNNPNILIIGQDRSDDVTLHSILKDEYQVVSLPTANEALQKFQNLQPDLIICNSIVQDMNRCELSSLLTEFSVSAGVPILMNVPFNEMSVMKELLPCVDDLITYPHIPEFIKTRVGMHLELRALRALHQSASMKDPLVGIATRGFLENQLGYEWRRALRHQAPQSLILADIDYFQKYNNAYGSLSGDECLRRISTALVSSVKRETDCVVRFENDEFGILLAETDLFGATQVATRISNLVEEMDIPHQASPVAGCVTMSFGVATLKPNTKYPPNRLINHASSLLQEAKLAGFNQIKSKMYLS